MNTHKKKIAIIRTDPKSIELSSYNCQELGLAKGLAAAGIDCDVYFAGNDTKTIVELEKTANTAGLIKIISLPWCKNKIFGQAIYPDIENCILSGKYNLLHVNEVNEITTYQIARIAIKHNIKFIVYQGMYKELAGRKNSLLHFLFRFLFYRSITNAFKIIAKTKRAEYYLHEKGFVNTTVFPVGLDASLFDNQQSYDLRTQLNIPNNHKILTYIGIFEKRRNIEFLLEIANSLKNDNFSLVLVGKGTEQNRIQEIIDAKQLVHVHLVGHLSQGQLPSIYEMSDLFLLASDYEIYGMVVLESLYHGCPVFSTKTAGPEDMIQNNKNGYLFDTMDANQWRSMILKTIETFIRKKISTDMKKKYLWENLARHYISQFLS